MGIFVFIFGFGVGVGIILKKLIDELENNKEV